MELNNETNFIVEDELSEEEVTEVVNQVCRISTFKKVSQK